MHTHVYIYVCIYICMYVYIHTGATFYDATGPSRCCTSRAHAPRGTVGAVECMCVFMNVIICM